MDKKCIENKNFPLPSLLINKSYAIGTKVSILLGLTTYSMIFPAVALGDVKFSVLESLPQKPDLFADVAVP